MSNNNKTKPLIESFEIKLEKIPKDTTPPPPPPPAIPTTNNKQSSVDWIFQQLRKNENIRWRGTHIEELEEQAKAMHKEEIMQAYSDGLGNGIAYADGQARNTVLDELKYYDEIFNSNV